MSSSFESISGKLDTNFPDFGFAPDDPIPLAQEWLKIAKKEKVSEPHSMVLTTANLSGEMTSRVMAILEFSDDGIIFTTHSCSRKIKNIIENPHACGHFYWKELGRQLSVGGSIECLPHELAKEIWDSRPSPLHSMSTVSQQSEPLLSIDKLRQADQALKIKGTLPCPERFSVYLLIPKSIEFWAAASDRLHRRLRFEKTSSSWSSTWLQP